MLTLLQAEHRNLGRLHFTDAIVDVDESGRISYQYPLWMGWPKWSWFRVRGLPRNKIFYGKGLTYRNNLVHDLTKGRIRLSAWEMRVLLA